MSENAVGWLYALFASFLFALVGLIVPNALRQARERRAHNLVKFWNEFLARHQLSYFIYYLAVGFTGAFIARFDRRVLAIPVGLTFASYVVGVYLSTHHQDDVLEKDHKCPNDASCATKLRPGLIAQILWPNALMALVLALIAWWTATKIA